MLRTCVLVGCVLVGVLGDVVTDYKQQILDMHNEYRRTQGASNMNVLLWNDSLATSANAWVEGCHFEHSAALQGSGVGENLGIRSSHATELDNIEHGIKLWYADGDHFTYGVGCEDGESCGHYTQMVWADTKTVGCATKTCAELTLQSGKTWSNAFFISCRYYPAGNFRGQMPYKNGTACSECLDGQTCDNDLCTGDGVLPCLDVPGKDCARYSAYCDTGEFPDYMQHNCQKTCNFC